MLGQRWELLPVDPRVGRPLPNWRSQINADDSHSLLPRRFGPASYKLLEEQASDVPMVQVALARR